MYAKIKDQQPKLSECFFAFSNEQYEAGIKKNNLENQKIFDGGLGLYGTQKGIQCLMTFYDKLSKEIAEKCTPQEVYDYEFNNHECGYTGNDSKAIEIVLDYFGKDAKIKRFC